MAESDLPARDPIRVLIADDHDIVRRGLARVLDATADMEVVGLASDGAEAVAMSGELRPDVVLMDLLMPGVDGVAATRQIAETEGAPKVVVLTSFSERERIVQAIDAGAVGYLLKDSESPELLAGIRAAADGESPLAPRVALELVRERRTGGALEALTDRERDVLRLVAGGVPNKQIAQRLGISPKTVKSHLTHIFRQIGVHDRLQAAVWAQRNGLLDDSDAGRGR